MRMLLGLAAVSMVLLTGCGTPAEAPGTTAPDVDSWLDKKDRACEAAADLPLSPEGMSPAETEAWVKEAAGVAATAVQTFDPEITALAEPLVDGVDDGTAADADEAQALLESLPTVCTDQAG
ncbi:hypothetical protein AB0I28_17185 [Phytomonospora sp. NPDC050363]|uniref:hypothetical protein n=1 Tax=Phytomonospora sp. NPDC050363 TaxID=3155642 RepID=UPI0033EABEDE